jgi:hypothetical protein
MTDAMGDAHWHTVHIFEAAFGLIVALPASEQGI